MAVVAAVDSGDMRKQTLIVQEAIYIVDADGTYHKMTIQDDGFGNMVLTDVGQSDSVPF